MGFYRRLTSLFDVTSQKTVSFTEAEQALQGQKKLEDPGLFTYDEEGFTYVFSSGPEKIKWSEIQRLVAYKVDGMTFDEIRMDIIWNDRQLTISEETPGWYQFLNRIKLVFPSIPDNWDLRIAQPPFATNHAVLYQREQPS